MRANQLKSAAILVGLFATAATAGAQTIKATQTNPSGIYAAGDTVKWTFEASGDNVASLSAVPYTIKKNLLTSIGEGTVDLTKGPVELSSHSDWR